MGSIISRPLLRFDYFGRILFQVSMQRRYTGVCSSERAQTKRCTSVHTHVGRCGCVQYTVLIAIMTSSMPNGKHVRSHSLKSFSAVTVAAIEKKSDENNYSSVATVTGNDAQATNPAAKVTSTWKQVFIFEHLSKLRHSRFIIIYF